MTETINSYLARLFYIKQNSNRGGVAENLLILENFTTDYIMLVIPWTGQGFMENTQVNGSGQIT